MAKKWSRREENELIKLYRSGVTFDEITRILGKTFNSIGHKASKLGLKSRARTEEHKKKLSDSLRGCVPWNKGKKGIQVAWNKGQKSPWIAGDKNPKWNGGKRKRADGYVQIWSPDHPRATCDGYVMEHILVMCDVLKRIVEPSEIVHHINGIRDDNRPENLMVFRDAKDHTTYHAYFRRRAKLNESSCANR